MFIFNTRANLIPRSTAALFTLGIVPGKPKSISFILTLGISVNEFFELENILELVNNSVWTSHPITKW